MKILVIDDSANHQNSAQQVLGALHDLTVVGSHDEALELLEPQLDNEKYKTLKSEYMSQGIESWPAHKKAEAESWLPYWDVVLCDLLMPAGRATQGGEGLKHVGKEMSVGWALAITAALRGAKYVAVVTDMGHHDHPASAMLDAMNNTIFVLHNAKALFTNYVGMVGIEGTQGTCAKCSGSGKDGTYGCYRCNGTGTAYSQHGKDWADILAKLLGEKKLGN
ncbi:MAG: hypothetical protein AAB497_02535 [Patescibacteria group bacterium]